MERQVGGGDAGVGEPPLLKPSPLGVGFALLVTFGCSVVLFFIGGSTWSAACDQPLSLFLVGMGALALLTFLVYFGLNSSGRESAGGAGAIILVLLVVALVCGSAMHGGSADCAAKSSTAYKATFATLLACMLLCFLVLSAALGSFGGPVFAVFGNLLHAMLAWLASLFQGLHSALSETPADEDLPVKRSTTGEFGLFINHAIFLWFFAYIFLEASAAWNDKCDRHLHRYCMVLGIYGFVMAYANFLYERFAGLGQRKALRGYFPYLFLLNLLLYLLWGSYGANETYSSKTCKTTAPDLYRLAHLLTWAFLVMCGLVFVLLLIILLDYCLSGRVRVIMVIEADIKVQ